MWITLLASASMALIAQPAERDTSSLETATAYMEAYSALDLDAMRGWLNEESVFIDETWVKQGETEAQLHVGEDAFMAVLEEFMEQYSPQGLNFEWDFVFESNDRVVFGGWVNALYPSDDPDQLYRWRTRQVTIITVEDGQVTHHRDYAGFNDVDGGLVPVE